MCFIYLLLLKSTDLFQSFSGLNNTSVYNSVRKFHVEQLDSEGNWGICPQIFVKVE